MFLGTNGAIARFQQRGSLSFFFSFVAFGHKWAPSPSFDKRGTLAPPFFSFPSMLYFPTSLLFTICFLVLVRKFVLFCFVAFATLVDPNLKKNKDF